MLSEPILAHFDYKKTSHIKCNALDYITLGVLSQEGSDGVLYLVAYFSRKIVPAECNYEIYNKELLAIIRCFEQWRPELKGTNLPI